MTETVEQITVLISHPSDMAGHGEQAKAKIEKIGQFLLKDGFILKAISWKTDAGSGYDEDGQSFLNEILEQIHLIRSHNRTLRSSFGTRLA